MGKTRGGDLPSCGVLCIYRGTYGIVQIYINIIISVSGKPVLYVLRRVKKDKKDSTQLKANIRRHLFGKRLYFYRPRRVPLICDAWLPNDSVQPMSAPPPAGHRSR